MSNIGRNFSKHRSWMAAVAAALLACGVVAAVIHAGETAEPSAGDSGDSDPWSEEQLLDPAKLAKTLEDPDSDDPVIFDIGGMGRIMGGRIEGSQLIGPAEKPENLKKLRAEASKLPKDADLVIYCGCCPFKDCPNIRPAFRALDEMNFANLKLLELATNLRVDWVNQGYPVADNARTDRDGE